MKRKPVFPIYPILAAPLPILVVLAVNLQQVNSLDGLRLVLLSMVFAGALLGLLGLTLRRDWPRAALITTILIVLSNLYGLLVWWSAVPVVVLSILLIRKARPSSKFGNYANFIGAFAMIFILAFIGWQAGPRDWFNSRTPVQAGELDQPDIYFIVLDSYTSHQEFLDRFGYDNSSFQTSLTALGFQVGDCQSAYPDTDYSLAWTLNPESSSLPDGMQLWGMIRASQVRRALEARGYRTVAFATGFVWTELVDADYYFQPAIFSDKLNVFEMFYLRQTPVDLLLRSFFDMDAWFSQIYRDRTQTLLQHLADPSRMEGPQFVFAHIIQPHPPFVFDANGSPADWRKYALPGAESNPMMRSGYSPEGYAAGYVIAARYIEQALLPPLASIVAAAPDSIVIIVGDHGPWYSQTEAEKLTILCAVRGANLGIDPRQAFDTVIK